ncbi:MAG: DUF5317 domain-containing protein [Candidatus Limnocylindrales bacterium]
MFILYAIVAGLVLGRLLGGRLEHLGDLPFRWVWVAIAGLAVQIVLFSGPVSSVVGAAGPPLYIASTAAVLAFVVRNARIAGMPLVALGAGLNLLVIACNGGTMPASRGALEAVQMSGGVAYTNSRLLVAPVLEPLGDVFALPAWMPLANVFSIGDVLVGLGILVVVAAGMRRAAAGAPEAASVPAPGTGSRASASGLRPDASEPGPGGSAPAGPGTNG